MLSGAIVVTLAELDVVEIEEDVEFEWTGILHTSPILLPPSS